MTLAWYLKPCVTAPELLVLGPSGLNPGWVSGTLETTRAWKSHLQHFLTSASLFSMVSTLHSICFQALSETFQLPSHICCVGMGLKATRTLLVCTKPVHPILSMTDTHANIHIGNIWGDISIEGQVLLYWDRPLPN